LPGTAWLLSFLASVVTLWLLWSAIRPRTTPRVAFTATGFAALSGPLAVAAMSGEGAALTATLAASIVVLLQRAGGRPLAWVPAGLAGAMLAACGNGLVVVFPVALAIRVAARRGATAPRSGWIPAAALFMGAVAAFHAWRVHTFGSLVAAAPGFDAGRTSFADMFVSQPFDLAPFGVFYAMLFVAAIMGVRVATDRRLPLLAAGTACATAAVTLTARDPLPGLAGSAALVPLLVICAAGLLNDVPRALRSRTLDATLVAALLAASLGWAMDLRISTHQIRESSDATLVRLGRWLATWRSDGTLLCDAPGAIPYYSRWRTSVVAGLPLGDDAPDVVMLTSEGMFAPNMGPAQTRVAASLADRYRVLAVSRRDWTRDRALIIYARADVPELTDEQRKSFPKTLGPLGRLNR